MPENSHFSFHLQKEGVNICVCVCLKYDHYERSTIFLSDNCSDPLFIILYKPEQQESWRTRNLKHTDIDGQTGEEQRRERRMVKISNLKDNKDDSGIVS